MSTVLVRIVSQWDVAGRKPFQNGTTRKKLSLTQVLNNCNKCTKFAADRLPARADRSPKVLYADIAGLNLPPQRGSPNAQRLGHFGEVTLASRGGPDDGFIFCFMDGGYMLRWF